MGIHREIVPDNFFKRDGTPCDRCGDLLGAYTMSWFTDDAICMDCSSKEMKLKKFMRDNDVDPKNFEGCGYIPNLMPKEKE